MRAYFREQLGLGRFAAAADLPAGDLPQVKPSQPLFVGGPRHGVRAGSPFLDGGIGHVKEIRHLLQPRHNPAIGGLRDGTGARLGQAAVIRRGHDRVEQPLNVRDFVDGLGLLQPRQQVQELRGWRQAG